MKDIVFAAAGIVCIIVGCVLIWWIRMRVALAERSVEFTFGKNRVDGIMRRYRQK